MADCQQIPETPDRRHSTNEHKGCLRRGSTPGAALREMEEARHAKLEFSGEYLGPRSGGRRNKSGKSATG
jgi:hypothetical protein